MDILAFTHGEGPILLIIENGLMPILQIMVPSILLVVSFVYLIIAKSSKDPQKAMAAKKTFKKLLIWAIIIFAIVTLISILLDLLIRKNMMAL
jgi:hypothetical protein